MGLLDGRVAVVTGAGRGIGRGIALCLAGEGARVVVNDIGVSLGGDGTDEDPAAQVSEEIVGRGGEAVANRDRVDDFEGAGRIIASAVDTFGQIDILVNNAGIVRDRTLVKMDEADYDAVVAVHQKGTFNTVRHAAPHMKEAGYGRIVNMTSSAGLRGNFGQTNYGAAKAAIMGMTFVWAVELGRYGITVNAMAPAGATRMTMGLAEEAESPPDQDPALNAPLVAFLVSEVASRRQRAGVRTDRVRVHHLPDPSPGRHHVAGGRVDAGPGRRPLPRGARPAPPAGGDAGAPASRQQEVVRALHR